jgi:hypothetical protein
MGCALNCILAFVGRCEAFVFCLDRVEDCEQDAVEALKALVTVAC